MTAVGKKGVLCDRMTGAKYTQFDTRARAPARLGTVAY